MDTIAHVRRAFHVQGWSVKKIARELNVSRNTVRKILRSQAEETHHPHSAYPLQPRRAPGRPSADRLQGGENWISKGVGVPC
ncbi:helix-turn-helix domain-containing protein [Agrobacterium fabrum]|uniref:helix-turn-helix domain-containing protein n=1 Tax=Agrobacterium fabrum TaxID=1176649 RepID=UPI0018D8DA14